MTTSGSHYDYVSTVCGMLLSGAGLQTQASLAMIKPLLEDPRLSAAERGRLLQKAQHDLGRALLPDELAWVQEQVGSGLVSLPERSGQEPIRALEPPARASPAAPERASKVARLGEPVDEDDASSDGSDVIDLLSEDEDDDDDDIQVLEQNEDGDVVLLVGDQKMMVEVDDDDNGARNYLSDTETDLSHSGIDESGDEEASIIPSFELPAELCVRLKSMNDAQLEAFAKLFFRKLKKVQRSAYKAVKKVVPDPILLVQALVRMLADQKPDKPLCWFVDALPQSGKTSIKAFLVAAIHTMHAYPTLKCQPFAVLMAQFKPLVEKVAEEIGRNVSEIEGISSFRAGTYLASEDSTLLIQAGGLLVTSKSRAKTIAQMTAFIRKMRRPCVLLLDESDVLAMGVGEYQFNTDFAELQRACAGVFSVSATIFHSLWDVCLQPHARFGGFVAAKSPEDYVGQEDFVPWQDQTIAVDVKYDEIPELYVDFFQDALSKPKAVIMAATSPRVRVGYTMKNFVENLALLVPSKDFIAIVVHGGQTPFKGQMGVGIFGQKRSEHRKKLRAAIGGGDEWDGLFVHAASLLPWLAGVELQHAPKDRHQLQQGGVQRIELQHICLLLTALRVTLQNVPIVVAGFNMLRRSLSIVGCSMDQGPLAALTHIVSLPSKQQASNETLQHFARAAGRQVVKDFRVGDLSKVQILTTERAWTALRGQAALAKWGIVQGADQRNDMLRALFSVREQTPDFDPRSDESRRAFTDKFAAHFPAWAFPPEFEEMREAKIVPFAERLNKSAFSCVKYFAENASTARTAKRVYKENRRMLDAELWEGVLLVLFAQTQLPIPITTWRMADVRNVFRKATEKFAPDSAVIYYMDKCIVRHQQLLDALVEGSDNVSAERDVNGSFERLQTLTRNVIVRTKPYKELNPQMGFRMAPAVPNFPKEMWQFTEPMKAKLAGKYASESDDRATRGPIQLALPKCALQRSKKYSYKKRVPKASPASP